MELLGVTRLVEPVNQLGHQLRRVKWRGCLKDDADLPTLLIDGRDAVRPLLVLTPMPGILRHYGEGDPDGTA